MSPAATGRLTFARGLASSAPAEGGGDGGEFKVLAIDRSGLLGARTMALQDGLQHGDSEEGGTTVAKSAETPLLSEMKTIFATRGPLTLAEYFQMCLGHPEFGYYQRQRVFGKQGDFVTSPELTQIFGELLGVWTLATWAQCGQPSPFHLVELGPGRGTLMHDILRTAERFTSFVEGVTIHLVENSLQLRERQKEMLNVTLEPSEDSEDEKDLPVMARTAVKGRTATGIDVHWHWIVDTVPADAPIFCIAHEFFDAIPIHQFQHTERGWCEVLVDSAHDSNDPHHVKYVLCPSPSPSTLAYLGVDADTRRKFVETMPQEYREGDPEDQNDKGSTPTSPGLIIDPPVQRGKSGVPLEADPGIPMGVRIEAGPMRNVLMNTLAKKIDAAGGAALIIDYGEDHPQPFTLRGIKDHSFASPLESPGEVDLSAHVDFSSLRRVARQASSSLQIFPVVPQGAFLLNLNIEARTRALCENASDEQKEAIEQTVMRLVSEDQMGLLFKVLAITQPGIGAPAGFPEDADGGGKGIE